jgi:hypothetical protein
MESMFSRRATVVGRLIGKPLLIGLAGLTLSAGASNAQTTGQGTFVAGAGAYSNGFSSGRVLQIGGGGEALVQNRFGIGGELGLAGGGGDAGCGRSTEACTSRQAHQTDWFHSCVEAIHDGRFTSAVAATR